jgi:acetoacetyl-CoA reductase/3-oxoacyl-[acyl-carrier protein] reductase
MLPYVLLAASAGSVLAEDTGMKLLRCALLATVCVAGLAAPARAQNLLEPEQKERSSEVVETPNFDSQVHQLRHAVADHAAVQKIGAKILEDFSRVDILVNNAGITRDKSLRKMTDEDWLEVVQTNLNAVFFCTSAAIPVMIAQNYGRIINLSSMNGQTSAFGQANYGASKGGIIAFTKTAALELAKFNITVNAICPGFTMTDMLSKVPENVQTQIRAKIPAGRFGTPEDMAKAVTFLVEGGDYITGQQININGGAYM